MVWPQYFKTHELSWLIEATMAQVEAELFLLAVLFNIKNKQTFELKWQIELKYHDHCSATKDLQS